ncbi:polysaccharide biosynthesis tyrosine autokinase [Tamlana sp. 62-3]|uniref:non-specific protein-tyrosine kinase n=1 Tax=Neotamlana sargassicola TaxID=2883125 RepID=A0A9X1I7E2_9FLAO|nr:tyrosine-protein kinase family protein [Tamlana sargassicola]MCB4809207.1 polysaccharide biosynthesis tyrosine autokinase [Tamlana sargassicola]
MEKDFFKILSSYLKYWYLFVIGCVICLVLAFLHIRYNVISEYYIAGKVLLNDKENGGGEASGLQSLSDLGLIKMSKNIQDEIGVLLSYDLMLETIKELDYAVAYYAEGSFNEVEVYVKSLPFKVVLNDTLPLLRQGTLGRVKVLDEFKFSVEKLVDEEVVDKKVYEFGEILNTEFGNFHIELQQQGKLDLKNTNPVIVRFKDPEALASNYNARLNVFPVYENGGGLLEIGLTDAVPQRGEDLINKLIEVYARNSAKHKNLLAESTLKLIDERLNLLTTDLNSAEESVENYKQSNNLTNVEADASRFIQLADQVDRELATLRTEINAIDALERTLGQTGGGNYTAISSYNIQNPALVAAIMNYNTVVQERVALVNATGIGNPMLGEIDKRLESSKRQILENLKGIKLQLTRSQRDLMNQSAQYRSKISSVPSAERALLEINRDQGLKQGLYLFLLQKKEEEALSISVPFADTRIIEEPRSSGYPINGAKTPVYLGAILFGLLVPFGFVFLKEKLNTKIEDAEEVGNLTSTPILGLVAHNNTNKAVVLSKNSNTPIAELFRLMRHNLKFMTKNAANQTIMVTSGNPGEGKTFVSTNLAASLALTGKKVVVLGFDLRIPKLTKELDLKYEYGLSDYIIDTQIQIQQLLITYQQVPNLHFIGAGTMAPNPGELIIHQRVEELFAQLKSQFDYIIIDTPPVGKVADAFALAKHTDAAIFVLRQNYTKKTDLKLVNEIEGTNKINNLMLVINDVKNEKNDFYGGYGNTGNTKNT